MATIVHRRRGVCHRCGLRINQSFSCNKNVWTGENGRRYPPITWGSEIGQWEGAAAEGEPCPECGVFPGAYHHAGCSIEQIPEGVDGPPPEPDVEADKVLEREPQQALGPLMYAALHGIGYSMGFITASPRRVLIFGILAFTLYLRACPPG